ncbi:hypothetical protein KC19_3G179300 [Ceratodon purpureus]|uniref:Uncharacterized protein n=1 Tax=Ceratodon purpureus TaxID=3225 RepID=A0A8T0IJR3_CERPU|nr:hypothetical protein KC19_3G179300 [Ceratodon purpureus]
MAHEEAIKPAAVQYAPAPATPVGNPVPLGLFGFGTATFVLSCLNAGIFGLSVTTPPNIVIGIAIFYGGIAQILASMWAFKAGSTFAATAFGSYGSFWLSYAVILIPWFGVLDSYTGYERDVGSALGVFILGFAIFSFLMWFATLRTNIALSALFVFLTITFTLLSIAEFKRADGLKWKRVINSSKTFSHVLPTLNDSSSFST